MLYYKATAGCGVVFFGGGSRCSSAPPPLLSSSGVVQRCCRPRCRSSPLPPSPHAGEPRNRETATLPCRRESERLTSPLFFLTSIHFSIHATRRFMI